MSEMLEPIKEANTTNEIRAELERLSYHDAIIRRVFDIASREGLSGEDKYALLAYHIMRVLRTYQSNTLDYVMTHPATIIIQDKDGLANTK